MSNNHNANGIFIQNYLLKANQDLPQLEINTNYYNLIKTIIKAFKEKTPTTQKDELILSITNSRRLIKYHQSLGLILFDNTYSYILYCIDITEDSDLLLNALLIFYEVFSIQNNNRQMLSKAVVSILKVASYNEQKNELVFAALVANQILTLFISNHIHNNIFAYFVDYFNYDDPLICQQAAKTAFDLILMLDKENRIKLIDWNYLIQKACDANLSNGNDKLYVTFISNAKALFNSNEWEELLMTLENNVLYKFQLYDSFDMRKIIQKRIQMAKSDD